MKQRVPPQNLEAEQSVLGGLMLDANAWDTVADSLSEGDFYKIAHQKIYSTIAELHRKQQPVDILTVSSQLKDRNELDLVGGPAYLAEIMDQTPYSQNILSYAKIVTEKALVRKMIDVSSRITERGYEGDYNDVGDFLDEAETEVFGLAETKKAEGLTAAADIVRMSLEKIEELYKKKAKITGVPTGFNDLDASTTGFQPGELIIVAARPGMGKTAFSLSVAQYAAIRDKRKVAFFSLEMPKEQVMTRLLAAEAKLSIQDLRIGRIADQAWPQLINAATLISDAQLYIDESSGISPMEIRAKARRLKAQVGLDLIIIDYLQLMDWKQKVESRERAVSEISKALKAIAKELKVPVIALAQLNRAVEGRSDRRPMVSDLRESGSIEQDADVIMLLYRDDYYEKENSEQRGVAEVIVGKQRNGPTGKIKIAWLEKYGSFGNLAPVEMMPPEPPRGGGAQQARPPNFASGL